MAVCTDERTPSAREKSLIPLIEGAQIPIVECDKRMVITHSNAAAELVFGYEPRELVGQRVNVLMLPGDSSAHDGYVGNYERTGVKKILSTVGRTVKGLRKDGAVLTLKLTTSATDSGYAAVFVNISDELKVENALASEKAKAEAQMKLLSDMLPAKIVQKLLNGDQDVSESHEAVTIVFSDIVKWTNLAAALPTQAVVELLNHLFSAFDELTETHRVFKVETIGDAYMAAAGIHGCADHALRVARFGLAMLEAAEAVPTSMLPEGWPRLQIRVGMHTGPAHTGVVGRKVPRFCFFGDTVNVASRMESHGVPGCVHASDSTASALLRLIGDDAAKEEGAVVDDPGDDGDGVVVLSGGSTAATITANSSTSTISSMVGGGKGVVGPRELLLVSRLLDGATIRSRESVVIKGKGLMSTYIIVPSGAEVPLYDLPPASTTHKPTDSAVGGTSTGTDEGAQACEDCLKSGTANGSTCHLPPIKNGSK